MRLVGLIALSLACSVASAQNHPIPKDGEFYVSGIGLESCGKYLTALEKHGTNAAMIHGGHQYHSQSAVFREWTQGYLAATNAANSRNERAYADMDGVMQWIKIYCQKDPTVPFATAVYQYAAGAQL